MLPFARREEVVEQMKLGCGNRACAGASCCFDQGASVSRQQDPRAAGLPRKYQRRTNSVGPTVVIPEYEAFVGAITPTAPQVRFLPYTSASAPHQDVSILREFRRSASDDATTDAQSSIEEASGSRHFARRSVLWRRTSVFRPIHDTAACRPMLLDPHAAGRGGGSAVELVESFRARAPPIRLPLTRAGHQRGVGRRVNPLFMSGPAGARLAVTN